MTRGEVTEVQKARHRLLENRAWVDENIDAIQKDYGGQWIVVVEEAIVAQGSTPEEVREALHGREEGLLMRVPLPGAIRRLI